MTVADAHALAQPTGLDLEASLRAVLGLEQAAVALRLAVRDGLSRSVPVEQLAPDQLLAVARALTRQRGVHAIIGRSFEIRLLSWLELAPRPVASSPSVRAPEPERIAELAALQLGGELEDPELQALAERAAEQLGLPAAAVSIVLDTAQYFAASHGLTGWMAAARGTPDEWALCRRVVHMRAPLAVEDASTEGWLVGNPLVEADGLRCYLGVPLISAGGQALGTLCVFGSEPREFSTADVERLRELAGLVTARLEARRS